MSALNFPLNPINGQQYPDPAVIGVNVYRYDSAANTWRLLGRAGSAIPGTYGDNTTCVEVTIDAAGTIQQIFNRPITRATNTAYGLIRPGVGLIVASGSDGNIDLLPPIGPSIGGVKPGSNVAISGDGTISVASATTLVPGIVQLNDTTASSSTTQALTAAAGKALQDQINALIVDALVFCGTYNAATSQMDYVTTEGSVKGFVVGQNIPAPSNALNGSFVIVSTPGTPTSPAPTQPVGSGDWIVCDAPPAQWVVVPIGRFIVASQVIFNPYNYVTATDVQTAIQDVVNRTNFFSLTAGTGLGGGTFNLAGGAQTINLLPPTATVIGGVKAGSNITIGPDGTINAVSGGTVGTITGVTAGAGLTGGGVAGVVTLDVGAGTGITVGVDSISLTNTTVTAGSYNFATLTVDAQGRLTSASSGAPVTNVATGTGLTGGPITTTGTISLANTAVTPGSYTTANITVDAQGRITSAANGAGGVTQIIAGSNITISPLGGTGAVTINSPGGGLTGLQEIDDISGSFNGATVSFPITISGSQPIPSGPGTGQLIVAVGGVIQTPGTAFTFDNATDTLTFTEAPLTGASFSGYVGGSADPITSIIAGTGLTGGGVFGTVALNLGNTAVTPGTYTAANITVDAQGRITAAANGSGGGGSGTVTSVATGTGLTGGPVTTAGTIALADTAVTPGTYTAANITVDAQGRITAAANGSGGGGGTVTSVATGTGLTGGPVTTTGTISLSPATVSTLGGVIPDGTTITILPDGTITAVSAGVGTLQTVTNNGNTTTNSITVQAGASNQGFTVDRTGLTYGSFSYSSSANQMGLYCDYVPLVIRSAGVLYLNSGSGVLERNLASFFYNGASNLGYAGSTKLSTTATGVQITGGLDVSGLSTFTNGTDSTNQNNGAVVFSGGVGIAQRLNVGGNFSSYGDFANFGDTSRLQFDVGASVSPNVRIRNIFANGKIRVDSVSGIDFEQYNNPIAYRARFDDTNVSLYSGASLKLQTNSNGVTVTGTTVTDQLTAGNSSLTQVATFNTSGLTTRITNNGVVVSDGVSTTTYDENSIYFGGPGIDAIGASLLRLKPSNISDTGQIEILSRTNVTGGSFTFRTNELDFNLSGNLSITGTSTFTGVATFTSRPVFNNGISVTTGSVYGSSQLILNGGLGGDTTFYNGGTAYSDFIFYTLQSGNTTLENARINSNGVLSLPRGTGGINVTGSLTASGLRYPTTDGTAGQVLTTNGAGVLSWTTGGSGSVGTLQQVTNNGNSTTNSIILYNQTTPTNQVIQLDTLNNKINLLGQSSSEPGVYISTTNISFGDSVGEFRSAGLAPCILNFRGSSGAYLGTHSTVAPVQLWAGGAELIGSPQVSVTGTATTITNRLIASNLSYPTTDGTANQVLTTNGAGTLGWLSTAQVVAAPASSASSGSANQIAFGTGFFYWYDGTQWLRTAGSTF